MGYTPLLLFIFYAIHSSSMHTSQLPLIEECLVEVCTLSAPSCYWVCYRLQDLETKLYM